MKIFPKNLEEASNEELMLWINTRDYSVTPLASDELTRRNLKNLQESIKKLNKDIVKFDKNTEKHNNFIFFLTLVLLFIGIVQVSIMVTTSGFSAFTMIAFLVVFFGGLFLIESKFFKSIDKN